MILQARNISIDGWEPTNKYFISSSTLTYE